MKTRASIAALLLFSAALLTGCTTSFGNRARATHVTGDKFETPCEQQATRSQTTQLQEDLRLANEQARLAEEKAELEKQKREFAEERLKQSDKTDKDKMEEDSSENKLMGES